MRYDIAQHNAKRAISLPNDEIAARYIAGETIAELAASYGVSRPTITKSLDATRTSRRPARQRPGSLSGARNPSWKGGRAYHQIREEKCAQAKAHYEDNRHAILGRRMDMRTPDRKAEAAASMRSRHAALRAETIESYGGRCACCGEDEPKFLELDHVNDDGAEQRRLIGRGSNTTYRALKRKGWPRDGYQLLCANCNAGKSRNGGICPHVSRKANPVFHCDGDGIAYGEQNAN